MDDMLETMYAANGIGLAAITNRSSQKELLSWISEEKMEKKNLDFL